MPPVDLLTLDLPDPVLRHLTHVFPHGTADPHPTRLTMEGRIDVGLPFWLPYRATWVGDGRSFTWRARAGVTPLKALHVTDRYEDGHGEMDLRLSGRVPLIHASGPDTARSAAGRAAGEAAMWATACLLDAQWDAGSDETITVTTQVGVERPTVTLTVDAETGAVRSSHFERWDARDAERPGYVTFGCDVLEERAFSHATMPSRIVAGWAWGTADYAPFFEATITAAGPA